MTVHSKLSTFFAIVSEFDFFFARSPINFLNRSV